MEFEPGELDRRLEEAAQARAKLRRATLEWRELGSRLLRERERGRDGEGSERSDDGDAHGR